MIKQIGVYAMAITTLGGCKALTADNTLALLQRTIFYDYSGEMRRLEQERALRQIKRMERKKDAVAIEIPNQARLREMFKLDTEILSPKNSIERFKQEFQPTGVIAASEPSM